MRVYRLCRRRHADLSGIGGTLAAGRWHSSGWLLYAASSRALAVLEWQVNLELELSELPNDLVFCCLDIPDNQIEPADQSIALHDLSATRAHGADWLASNRSLVLAVPSVVVPAENNLLINCRHRQMAAVAEPVLEPWQPDERLVRF